MGRPLAVLLVEDSEFDAELVDHVLTRAGFDLDMERVADAGGMRNALGSGRWQCIISDFNLPLLDGFAALEILQESGLDIPFIVVSGSIGEERAVALMKAGASDYIMKDNLMRLPAVIERELTQCDIRHERKVANQRLHLQSAALDAAANAIVITDRNGTIEWVNTAFTRTTGYSMDESIGKNPRDLVKSGVHDRTLYEQMWSTILEGHIWRGELTNKRKDGSLYLESQTITPVRDARGDITHFIAIKEDVTERRTLETQLQQAQKLESIGRLAGGVAHDFNNLLGVISGYAEFIFSDLPHENPLRGDVSQILEAVDKAAALVQQLLAFSRKQVTKTEVLNLNQTIAGIEKMLHRIIGEDVTIKFVPGAGLGNIMADRSQIEQIIMNLAVNARDAMPQGGVLTFETANVFLDESYAAMHQSVVPGPYVMLSVADTGFGMDKATLDRIFEPFFTTKEQGKGTGLGLATVYGIVKQNRGNIWVYSELGRGTVFKVYFPRAYEDVHSTTVSESNAVLRGHETVLLVEDDDGVRDVTQRMLERAGYTVHAFSNGHDALTALARSEQPIHLVITDIIMPQMAGTELVKVLEEKWPQLKVIYVSGYANGTIGQHGLIPADAPFIEKPFSSAELTQKIREVLDAG